MLYVARDDKGRINAVSRRQGPRTQEPLPENNPELLAFLSLLGEEKMRSALASSDADMGRITEDLLDVLVSRNIINFTDLPRTAQHKLLKRQSLRRKLSELSTLVAEDDELL